MIGAKRLILIAPQSVLEAAKEVNQLLSRFEHRDQKWKAEWRKPVAP